jgi:hypothetical protein
LLYVQVGLDHVLPICSFHMAGEDRHAPMHPAIVEMWFC